MSLINESDVNVEDLTFLTIRWSGGHHAEESLCSKKSSGNSSDISKKAPKPPQTNPPTAPQGQQPADPHL